MIDSVRNAARGISLRQEYDPLIVEEPSMPVRIPSKLENLEPEDAEDDEYSEAARNPVTIKRVTSRRERACLRLDATRDPSNLGLTGR
jgi:hypothetical protein